jgi:hypothetical protein
MVESNRAITMAAQGLEDVDQADSFGGKSTAIRVTLPINQPAQTEQAKYD